MSKKDIKKNKNSMIVMNDLFRQIHIEERRHKFLLEINKSLLNDIEKRKKEKEKGFAGKYKCNNIIS